MKLPKIKLPLKSPQKKVKKKAAPTKRLSWVSLPARPYQWILSVLLSLVIVYLFIGLVITWNAYVRQQIGQRSLTWYPLPAATVGTNVIPLSRYNRDLNAITRYITTSNTQDQYSKLSVKEEVLNRLIRAALIERIAHRNGITVTEQQITDAYNAAAAEEPGSVEEVLDRYYGFKPADFKVWVAEYILEDAVKTQVPKARVINHILISVDPSASEDAVNKAKDRAQSIVDKIKNGGNFAEQAKQESNDLATRDNGGALGNLTRGPSGSPVIDQAFEDAAFTAPLNEIVGPVRSSRGWHIIQVTAETGKVDSNFDTILKNEQDTTRVIKFISTK